VYITVTHFNFTPQPLRFAFYVLRFTFYVLRFDNPNFHRFLSSQKAGGYFFRMRQYDKGEQESFAGGLS
jgi:hypothetical protein